MNKVRNLIIFKEANNELSKTNQLMFKDLKKFQAELDKYNDVNYASKVEIDCAKAKGDLMSYKIEFEKSSNAYTQKINDLNQTISDMKKELCAHQETISIMSQAKEAQIKLYKTREDKELDKVIALENKVKVLNDIVYKTGQSVQTMNMLNRNCKTSFAKPEFLKKAQRANPRLYDIGCYNDNLALMLAPDSDEMIRLDKERRSKLSDLIRPFDYDQLNNLYDLFVPQREKSAEQHYFPKTSKMSHTSSNKEFSKESFRVIPTTSVSRPQLKSNQLEDIVMSNNSQGKKQEVEDHRRNFKFSNNKKAVTAYNDSLNAKTSNVNFVCATCGKCVLNENHDLCVLHYINGVNSRTRKPMAVPISTRKPKQNVNQSVATSKGIRHETSTARTPEQNGVVKRRNRTLVEAARTMLSAAKVPLFFWAEAIATACFTQNRSLVIPRHEKTPYHIINARKPSVKFFHIFGSLCYIVRDGENLDKMKEKGDACIFVGYSTQSKAYRVFNKRTRIIVETIHVNFDELPQMVSDHVSSDPVAETVTTSNELELLYSPMFSELINGNSPVVSKSSAVHAADNPDKRQQHNTTHTSTTTDVADPLPLNIHSTHQTPTQVPTVTAPENINQAETNAENAQFDDDEFINIFSTPIQDQGETSSHHVDSSNMHTFYQHHPSAQRWTKDHPLDQVIGNPSQSVLETRRH
ncbi:retrovirus-related pol polyprotein from transposon TNT 1-94 [Tanacetum coccineum]